MFALALPAVLSLLLFVTCSDVSDHRQADSAFPKRRLRFGLIVTDRSTTDSCFPAGAPAWAKKTGQVLPCPVKSIRVLPYRAKSLGRAVPYREHRGPRRAALPWCRRPELDRQLVQRGSSRKEHTH